MPRTAEPLRDRIARRSTVDGESGCWNWDGAKNSAGYGRITLPTGKAGGETKYAHRVAYEVFVGPVPEGLKIDHLCRNTSCCNPDHLEPVTQTVNLARGRSALSYPTTLDPYDASEARSAARIVADLPEHLKSERTRRGLSLRDVAAECGVSFNTLSRIERRTAEPTHGNVVSVLQWLAESKAGV